MKVGIDGCISIGVIDVQYLSISAPLDFYPGYVTLCSRTNNISLYCDDKRRGKSINVGEKKGGHYRVLQKINVEVTSQ